jgi:NAD-dependent deacetylase
MTADYDIPDALVAALRNARHICILTGAGVSAESGVPTFRDVQDGLWAEYDPQELATPDAFLADPALVWRWYRWRRELVAAAEPNAGHYSIAQLASRIPEVALITQNVDNLHQRAGSTNVIEFHGNLFDDRCFSCETRTTADEAVDIPTCPYCEGSLRPGVVWFGEGIPEMALRGSYAAAIECDVFLSVGTSSTVYPAAGLANLAKENDAITVEINPNFTTHTSDFDFAIAGKSGVVLPELLELLAL